MSKSVAFLAGLRWKQLADSLQNVGADFPTCSSFNYRRQSMKLQQIVGKARVSDLVRHRLEQSHFYSAETAQQILRREFPNHVIAEHEGKISVLVRDKSFAVAVFKEVL